MEQHVFTAGVGSNLEELPKIIPHKKFSSPPTPPPPPDFCFLTEDEAERVLEGERVKSCRGGGGAKMEGGSGKPCECMAGEARERLVKSRKHGLPLDFPHLRPPVSHPSSVSPLSQLPPASSQPPCSLPLGLDSVSHNSCAEAL